MIKLSNMSSKNEIINPYVIPGLIRDEMPESAHDRINCLRRNILSKDQLIEIIATEANVSVDMIFSLCREREYVFARNIYTKIQKIYGKKLTHIGKDIKKDHTTIIHSLKQFDNRYALEDEYREISNRIFNKVGIDLKNVK